MIQFLVVKTEVTGRSAQRGEIVEGRILPTVWSAKELSDRFAIRAFVGDQADLDELTSTALDLVDDLVVELGPIYEYDFDSSNFVEDEY